ncbi:MAG: RICIN domain-containing protein [Polyangiales bacterium]
MRGTILSMCLGICLAACAADEGELDEVTDDAPLIAALQASGSFVFRNEGSKHCIGVDRASTTAGARLKQFECDCAANQTWRIESAVAIANHRALSNAKSKLCIGIDGASTKAGADLMQFPCDRKGNQQWAYEEQGKNGLGETLIRFRNAGSKLCIGVDGSSKSNGAQLKQFPCDTRANQRWVVHSPSFCSL